MGFGWLNVVADTDAEADDFLYLPSEVQAETTRKRIVMTGVSIG
jgi:hypothetical protein